MKFRVFLFVLLSVANAFASDLDFTLVNQTARSFEGLYITDSGQQGLGRKSSSRRKSAGGWGKDPRALQERRKIRNLGFQPGGRRGTLGNLR